MSAGLSSSLPLLSTPGAGGLTVAPLTATLSEGIQYREGALIANKRYNAESDFGVGIAPAQTQKWYIGRTIAEVVGIQLVSSPTTIYGWTVAEQLHMAQALSAALPVSLAEGIGAHVAMTASIGVTILQRLGIAESPLPTMLYTQTLVQGIGAHDALLNFFGASLSDGIGQLDGLTVQFRANPVLSDLIEIAPALTQKLYIRVTLADGIEVADDNPLQMIFDGQLVDGVSISVGYVSPDGQFTTWAMNTRSGAVTEYSNYAFNSFAQIGDFYVGASDSGLYKLLGDNDAGTDIIADIKSGYAEWGGSKFTMFKAAYLGLRGAGDYVLKLITGDGKTYIYAVSGRDMRSTKINVGKGIRTRYFAFDLLSTGQDFDLDTIEFVPVVADRRV